MPLPKIAIAKFPITIPSTKKNTFFRPFLMKEQKILHMAMHAENIEHMFKAMCDIVESCVDGITDAKNMPMFDLEYLFMKIRAKSVGELIQIGIKCKNCEKTSKTEIDLETIEVEFQPDISNKIMISDNMGIILRYPCLNDISSSVTKSSDLNDTESMIQFVCDSIENVFDGTSVWTRKDFTDDEIREFVESMNTSQMELVGKFYANIPTLSKRMQHKCSHCGHEQTIDFRRLQDFFM